MKYLLVNPWIYDFSAYNFGIAPVGLLKIASSLKQNGHRVHFIDCLSRSARSVDEYGFSKYRKVEVDKPEPLKHIRRPFFRYGISVEDFRSQLDSIDEAGFIFVTSGMTYWYPGVKKAISLSRERFPKAVIHLGGIYATLCHEHARENTGADAVHKGDYLDEYCSRDDFFPAYELLADKRLLPLQTSVGCPFNCSYCATNILKPTYKKKDPVLVFEELMHCLKGFGTRNFVFYDDALLHEPEDGIKKLLRMVVASREYLTFHTPNGLHAKFIDEELAYLMRKANFRDLRISLETSDEAIQEFTGAKVTNDDVRRSVRNLKEAGFEKQDIGVYILIGAPWISRERTLEDISFVCSIGAKAVLASYSPIPGTKDYKALIENGMIGPDMDPLWHNKTVFCEKIGLFTVEEVREIRRLTSKMSKMGTPP